MYYPYYKAERPDGIERKAVKYALKVWFWREVEPFLTGWLRGVVGRWFWGSECAPGCALCALSRPTKARAGKER